MSPTATVNARLMFGKTAVYVVIPDAGSEVVVTLPVGKSVPDGLRQRAWEYQKKADRYTHAATQCQAAAAQFEGVERDTANPLAQIAHLLDRQIWDGDTLNAVADVIRSAGFQIRDPEEIDR